MSACAFRAPIAASITGQTRSIGLASPKPAYHRADIAIERVVDLLAAR
jgi:hypothetical protein